MYTLISRSSDSFIDVFNDLILLFLQNTKEIKTFQYFKQPQQFDENVFIWVEYCCEVHLTSPINWRILSQLSHTKPGDLNNLIIWDWTAVHSVHMVFYFSLTSFILVSFHIPITVFPSPYSHSLLAFTSLLPTQKGKGFMGSLQSLAHYVENYLPAALSLSIASHHREMSSNKTAHSLWIDPGPTARVPSDKPSYTTVSHMQRASFVPRLLI